MALATLYQTTLVDILENSFHDRTVFWLIYSPFQCISHLMFPHSSGPYRELACYCFSMLWVLLWVLYCSLVIAKSELSQVTYWCCTIRECIAWNETTWTEKLWPISEHYSNLTLTWNNWRALQSTYLANMPRFKLRSLRYLHFHRKTECLQVLYLTNTNKN
jgi:hypothetical protein